jgi:hypothetical protein
MNGCVAAGLGFFRPSFDKLRTNGKILNLMAVTPERGNDKKINLFGIPSGVAALN